MKKIFFMPTIEFLKFEAEETVMISGLVISDESSSVEHTTHFSAIQNIFLNM